MFINKDSIQVKISGMLDYISLGQYLTEAKYGYHKLWSSSSGRSLSGAMTGVLVGIFPKLTLQFRPLTKSELEIIAPILDSANQSIKYYDPNKKTTVEMTTYTGDYQVINRHIISGDLKNDGFNCSFIAVRKRS